MLARVPTRYNVSVLLNTKFIIGVVCTCAIFLALGQIPGTTITYSAPVPIVTLSADTPLTTEAPIPLPETDLETDTSEEEPSSALATVPETTPPPEAVAEAHEATEEKDIVDTHAHIFSVPFYSQLTDISAPEWKKIGCGIASLAMLIEFHKPNTLTSVDTLLQEGIDADAYTSAGWTYAGLIGVSHKYGLDGTTRDFGGSSMDVAFGAFEKALAKGPVMASVHYTFTPTNPIPHLVIVNGIEGDTLYYNDPAEKSGNGSIPVSQFKSSWKKRYIEFYKNS